MALIIVLSVYNGIGNLTQGLFNLFDPELKVEPAEGKSFSLDAIAYDDLLRMNGVSTVSPLVEENAWVTHGQHEAIVTLRGVDSLYGHITGIDTMLYKGVYELNGTTAMIDAETGESDLRAVNYFVLGGEVYSRLGLTLVGNTPMAVHIPKRGSALGMTMEQAFNTGYAMPAGMFFVQQDIDSRYVLADISFVRSLLSYADDECTALAITLDGTRSTASIKEDVQKLLGDDFLVKDRFDQQPLYYKIFRSERIGIILILALIVLISTLNLVASLALLIIDKRHDIGIMRSMGMQESVIRRAFFAEGLLISGVGIAAGLLIGFVVCFLQQQFGIVRMGDNFIVDAFPVAMRAVDFVLTFVLVSVLSGVSVLLTTLRVRL